MSIIEGFDPGKPESALYDASLALSIDAKMVSFKGYRIVSPAPLTIEAYNDQYYTDAGLNVLPMWTQSAYGLPVENSWPVLAVSNLADANSELAFSESKADEKQVEQISWVGGPSLEILAKYLDQAAGESYIPFEPTLGQYITKDEADLRYANLKKWIEEHGHYGGSWGSTLGLAYAEAHPEQCSGLVLRGIFLCRQSEIDWFLYGVRAFFPEAQRQLAEFIPQDERHDLLGAYHRRLIDPDPAVHQPAAHQWATFEASCSTLLPSPELVAAFVSTQTALSLSRIEAHYFVNHIFLPDNSLLANVGRIRSIPAVIVQGRYDAVCPIVSADDLARTWPEARYVVVADAGHSAFEPGIARELVAACDRFAQSGAFN